MRARLPVSPSRESVRLRPRLEGSARDVPERARPEHVRASPRLLPNPLLRGRCTARGSRPMCLRAAARSLVSLACPRAAAMLAPLCAPCRARLAHCPPILIRPRCGTLQSNALAPSLKHSFTQCTLLGLAPPAPRARWRRDRRGSGHFGRRVCELLAVRRRDFVGSRRLHLGGLASVRLFRGEGPLRCLDCLLDRPDPASLRSGAEGARGS